MYPFDEDKAEAEIVLTEVALYFGFENAEQYLDACNLGREYVLQHKKAK